MRRLELALVFAAAFAIYWPVVFGVRPRRGVVALVLAGALFAQLQFEGFRWQMVPVYFGAVALAIGDVFFLERKLDWSDRLLRAFLGTVGLVLTLLAPVVLPVPELPAPGGRLIASRSVTRSATFVFVLGERFFGTVTISAREPYAAKYSYTSALGGATSFVSVLSLPYLLDGLVPQLATALDGDPATAVSPAP